MLQVCIALIALGFAAAAPGPGLTWKDCSADPSSTALTVHDLSISPSPVVLPGNISISLNATVNQRIDTLFLDVQLNRTGSGADIVIPCIPGTDLGSCTNINACDILTKVLNGSSVLSVDLGMQLDTILLSALGHKAQCPVSPETVKIQNERVQLKPLPALLSAFISDATYKMRFTIKEAVDSTSNIGCLEVTTGLVAKSGTGFLFG